MNRRHRCFQGVRGKEKPITTDPEIFSAAVGCAKTSENAVHPPLKWIIRIRAVRSLKLIWLLLLTLALAASFARPHLHTGVPSTDDAVCTKCQARDNPAELGEGPVSVILSGVSFSAPRPAVEIPIESSRCLDRAPKQGPPEA